MTLDERIREDLDHQEACGWHHDWPEALAALRAVLDLPGMREAHGPSATWLAAGYNQALTDVRETMAQALGVTS